MTGSKITRRVFLKGIGTVLFLGGCNADITPEPETIPSPTPLPGADNVALTYLNSWNGGDYEIMYSLLTPASKSRFPLNIFKNYYLEALTVATVTQVDTQLQSLLRDGDKASATFTTVWQTTLFGSIEADNQLNLQFVEDRWGVEWLPTLVYPGLGEGVHLIFLGEQQPARGNIYDSRFHALASQGQMVTVGVIPQLLKNKETVIDYLSGLTLVKSDKILKKINSARADWFVPIANIDFKTSLANNNSLNNLAGVERRAYDVRTYNDDETAAHIIGYLGAIPPEREQEYLNTGYGKDELVGLAGIEGQFEQELAGKHGGRLVTISSSNNQVLAEVAVLVSQAGSSVHLTLDTKFQQTVETLLGERLGAVVVMNPNTGDIYASASYPRFKPAVFNAGFDVNAWQELYADKRTPLVNRATLGVYPPASIFKIVTMAAGMEELGLKADQSFFCDGTWDGLGKGFEKSCWLKTGHGKIDLLNGLTESCDVVFYEVGLALQRSNPELLPKWADAFGLGKPTGILGLEEASGVVPDNAWKQTNFGQPLFDGDAVNSAIGQGFVLATPLQIVNLIASIANGGYLMRPRIVKRITDVAGTEQIFQPEISSTLPLSPETLAVIQNGLKGVVNGVRGTARQAFQGVSYTAAGKTGTAETGQKEPHSWFAGYAPAEAPRVAISVILEHAGEGSKQAAPLFRQILEAFFDWETTAF